MKVLIYRRNITITLQPKRNILDRWGVGLVRNNEGNLIQTLKFYKRAKVIFKHNVTTLQSLVFLLSLKYRKLLVKKKLLQIIAAHPNILQRVQLEGACWLSVGVIDAYNIPLKTNKSLDKDHFSTVVFNKCSHGPHFIFST